MAHGDRRIQGPVAFAGSLSGLVALFATVGVGWTVHLWVGTIYLAGAVGALVGVLAGSPDAPAAGQKAYGHR